VNGAQSWWFISGELADHQWRAGGIFVESGRIINGDLENGIKSWWIFGVEVAAVAEVGYD